MKRSSPPSPARTFAHYFAHDSALVKGKPDASVIINGDKEVKYDVVMQVMEVLTRSGVKNPGLGFELKK